MYKLVFENKTELIIDNSRSLKIGLAKWNGKNTPKYLYLWFKSKYIDKKELKPYENSFFYKKLLYIDCYDEENNYLHRIQVPEPFINLYWEEDDLVVNYGDQLYSDEAY